MIVVVTPNPAVDVTYRVDEQSIGTTQRVRSVERRPGGKGLNVARVLADQGVATHSVLPLSGAAGAWIADAVAAAGLTSTAVPVSGETRTTVTVVDDHAHPTMFGEPGPTVTPESWRAVDDAVHRALPGADALVVSGSLPIGAPATVVTPWIVDAIAAGRLVVADLSGPALLAAADAGATVCKPNREELADATGHQDERDGALELLHRGARLVVVSRGTAGIAAHSRSTVVEVPAVPGVTGNPTGAGDAATAGLVLALLDPDVTDDATATGTGTGTDDAAATGTGTGTVTGMLTGPRVLRALRTAAAFGAAAVLRPVAGEIDHDAAHRFLTALDSTRSTA
jgi:tagatose 6-phosphate kinase